MPKPVKPVAVWSRASRPPSASQPSSGLFSNPKMRNGSSRTFATTETTMTYIGVRVSPWPRISAEKTKNPNRNGIPKKIISM